MAGNTPAALATGISVGVAKDIQNQPEVISGNTPFNITAVGKSLNKTRK